MCLCEYHSRITAFSSLSRFLFSMLFRNVGDARVRVVTDDDDAARYFIIFILHCPSLSSSSSFLYAVLPPLPFSFHLLLLLPLLLLHYCSTLGTWYARVLDCGFPSVGLIQKRPWRSVSQSVCLSASSVLLPCLALPCLALPCLALPCLALPCLALPCLASSVLTS